MNKKILVVTPRFPFDYRGACEQDRAYGIKLLRDLGYSVHVITLCHKSHIPLVDAAQKDFDVTITPILYRYARNNIPGKIFDFLKRIFYYRYWDGAAFEYTDSTTQSIVQECFNSFKPDLVWFDYTYLWPLYPIPQKAHVPIITRSINYEPDHFFNASKKTLFDSIRYYAKVRSEQVVMKKSDHIFSITKKEEDIYRKLGAKNISTLPLRRIGVFIGKNPVRPPQSKIHVVFMGSNYMVHHMFKALMFILNKVNPLLQKTYPGMFEIHVIGGKIPESIATTHYDGITFHGYIPDLDEFMKNVDIALVPSLSGEGMQQKVFEPIVRGIPTITSTRALAGYSFENGTHLLTLEKDDPEGFVEALGKLSDVRERERISTNAILRAQKLFSEDSLKTHIHDIIEKLIRS